MGQVARFFVVVCALGALTQPAWAAPTGHLTQLTFEVASPASALPEMVAVTGSCTRATSGCASGTGCYRFNPSAAICNARASFAATPIVRAFARFRVGAYPSGVFGHDFFGVGESGFGTGVFVDFTDTDRLRLVSLGSGFVSDVCGPLATPVALGTWYGVRIRAEKSDNATVSLDLLDDDGNLLDSATCTNQPAGGGNFNNVRVGSTNGFGATADITIDDVDIHTDAAWPGNVRWAALEPTAVASCGYTANGCAGSASRWQCVDEDPPSDGDTTYLSGSGTTRCTFNHATAVAKGIEDPLHGTLLWWNARSNSGSPTMIGVLGTTDVGTAKALTGSYADFLTFNPGNPPNAAQLDTTPFGVRMIGSGGFRVTATRLIVGFEDAVPPPPTPTPELFSLSQSLADPAPQTGDEFGAALATAGGFVVVGVPDKGLVRVYDHVTGALLRTITNPNPSAGDRFGQAVAAEGAGKDFAVGAPYDDSDGVDAGAVYWFDGLTGALLKKFKNPNPGSSGAPDEFGAAVTVVANRVVVGAPGEDTNGADAGAVYVFELGTAAQPNGVLQTTLVKPAPVGTTEFGSILSSSGDTIVVGDPADNFVAAEGGAVFLFPAINCSPAFCPNYYVGSVAQTLRESSPVAGDRFGASFAQGSYSTGAFTGVSRILVGAPGDDTAAANAGAVVLFDPGTLSQVGLWTKPGAGLDDRFGTALAAVRARSIVIGTPNDDSGGVDSGAAYVFDLEFGGLVFTFDNPDPQTGDHFGAVVAGGRHGLVGAPDDSTAAFGAGGVYLYERGVPDCADSEPASVIGEWSAAVAHPSASVHTILTSESTVLFFQGSEVWYEATPTYVFDPATSIVTEKDTPSSNLFCSGHTHLEDGRVFVVGGTSVFINGIAKSFAFDPIAESWATTADMQFARWYPTATLLDDGRVLATQGHISGGANADIPEIYDPLTDQWTTMNASATRALPLYPFMFVLPSGKVLYAGGPDSGPAGTNFDTLLLDLTTQSWSALPDSTIPGGSAAMYEPGKIVKCGGENSSHEISTGTAMIDTTVGSPTWTVAESMDFPRSHHNLVLLPDGKALAVGGSTEDFDDPAVAVMAPELFDPASAQWSRVACMQIPRMYHSGAVLLPDGRVLSQGGDNYPSYQIYSPAYLFRGSRPAITSAPGSVNYGETFTVVTPNAASIASIVMMRTGAATHAFDQNQRRVPVSFSLAGSDLSVTAPSSDTAAPPGYYMLFLLDGAGTPSVSTMVQLVHESGCP